MNKIEDEAFVLLDEMDSNNYQCHMDQIHPNRVAGVAGVDTSIAYKFKLMPYC